MEFHENKAKTPFIRLVQLWHAVRRWRRQMQTRRVLQQMSDERLRDIGLRRDGCGVNYGRRVGKCCLSAFKIATKSNHKSRLQHIFLIYIQIMT